LKSKKLFCPQRGQNSVLDLLKAYPKTQILKGATL